MKKLYWENTTDEIMLEPESIFDSLNLEMDLSGARTMCYFCYNHTLDLKRHLGKVPPVLTNDSSCELIGVYFSG